MCNRRISRITGHAPAAHSINPERISREKKEKTQRAARLALEHVQTEPLAARRVEADVGLRGRRRPYVWLALSGERRANWRHEVAILSLSLPTRRRVRGARSRATDVSTLIDRATTTKRDDDSPSS